MGIFYFFLFFYKNMQYTGNMIWIWHGICSIIWNQRFKVWRTFWRCACPVAELSEPSSAEEGSSVCSGAGIFSAVKIKVPYLTHWPNRKKLIRDADNKKCQMLANINGPWMVGWMDRYYNNIYIFFLVMLF